MSLNFISDFQLKLHNLLAVDKEISSQINQIYLSIMQDAKYPFLLINILGTQNHQCPYQNMYQIEFEIIIFARDKNQGFLTIMADKICTILRRDSADLGNYRITGIQLTKINFQPCQDLVTSKLIMHYIAFLKEEINL